MLHVIDKIERKLILAELTPDRFLRHSNKGGNEIYVVDAFNAPHTMREIGRLREIAFRDAGGGTGKDCDIDEFDTMPNPCRQMIVWNPETQEILGGYRFILGRDITLRQGRPHIAMSHMFEFSPRFVEELMPATLELGRSFVVIDYQNTKARPKSIYTLDNLWDGLAAVTMVYPEIKYLLGKVTMYPGYDRECRDLILGFMQRVFADPDRLAWPMNPLRSGADRPEIRQLFADGSYEKDYPVLNSEIRKRGNRIPPLVNAYMSLSPSMRMLGTAINDDFGDVEESGIFFKIKEIFEEKKRRHFDTFRREESGYARAVANGGGQPEQKRNHNEVV